MKSISVPAHDRVIFLDILRILAIFLVILAHLFQFLGIDGPSGFFGIWNFFWVSAGGVGITIFLFVSGCSLALRYPSFSGLNAVKRFYIRRAARIYPAYWMATLITVILFGISIPGFFGNLSIGTILLTMSGICYYFLGAYGGPIMGVGWFIGLLFALYLMYPLMAEGFVRNRNGTLLLVLTISVTARIACGYLQAEGIGYRLVDWVPFCRLFEFGLGIWVVRAGLDLDRLHVSDKASSLICFAGGLSYPLFLINPPFLVYRDIYSAIMTDFGFSVSEYFVVSAVLILILALAIHAADQEIQKHLR